MKGMLGFLERAGLVKNDTPQKETVPAPSSAIGLVSLAVALSPDVVPHASARTVVPGAPLGLGAPLNLNDIYSIGGVAPSLYPAERLLRLLDGLSAMDEATRLMAIKAMDAADESWSIEDPLADAVGKYRALTAHAQLLQDNLQALQNQTQTRLDGIAARQEQVVGDIRKQITELEALAARELSRAAADTATQQADLKAAQDQTARELDEIAQHCQRLQSLSSQFGGSNAPTKE